MLRADLTPVAALVADFLVESVTLALAFLWVLEFLVLGLYQFTDVVLSQDLLVIRVILEATVLKVIFWHIYPHLVPTLWRFQHSSLLEWSISAHDSCWACESVISSRSFKFPCSVATLHRFRHRSYLAGPLNIFL